MELKSVAVAVKPVVKSTKPKSTIANNCGGNCTTCHNCHHETVDNMDIMVFKNRSDIEACIVNKATGEIIKDRIPVKWKSIDNKLDYLSVSKVQTYERCPASFYYQYMSAEGTQEDNGNFFTKFGTILHEVVETASNYYINTGITFNPITLYDNVWALHNLSDFDAYREGKELIKDYFTRNPIDKRSDKTLCVEKEWRGKLGDCEVFGCMIDYAGIYKNNPTVGILKDYKTNRMPYTTADLESSLQLKIYESILRLMYPEVKEWVTGYELFRYGWQQCPPRTEDDLNDAIQYISSVWKQIIKDNIWAEDLNNYCGYQKCRFTCKTYQDFVNHPDKYVNALYNNDYSSINKQRELMITYEKIAKTRKEESSNMLKTAIQEATMNGQSFIVDGNELELYSSSKQSYKYYDTRNVLLSNNKLNILEDCLTISKTKLDSMLRSSPELKLQLASCMSTNYASPYITVKKKKKK